jgi:hypothetical protein
MHDLFRSSILTVGVLWFLLFWVVKVKLSLYLTKHYAMKAYGGMDV